MKIIQYIIILPVVAWVLMASCTDDKPLEFTVEKPESIAQYEYLNTYDVLKSYLRSDANPNFKLGAGMTVSDYVSKGFMYNMMNSNFVELTAGNAMKYASVVSDDGSMNFAPIIKFVQTAKDAGMEIYGHTLCWHAQQNTNYLKGLIAPTEIQGEDTWKELISGGDAEGDASSFFMSTASIEGEALMYTADGEGAGGTGRALKVVTESVGENDYETQFFITFPTMAEKETYVLSMDIRSDVATSIGTQAHTKPQDYIHWEFFGNIPTTTQWKTFNKEITVTASQAGAGAIAFNIGNTATTYYIDNISLKKLEKGGMAVLEPSIITNTDFESGVSGWGGWGGQSSRGQSAKGEGYNSDYAYMFTNPTKVNPWEAQVAFDFPDALLKGSTYVLNFQVKATVNGSISAGIQDQTIWEGCGDFGSFSLTTEWVEKTLSVIITEENGKRFLFNFGDYVGSIYIDNITLRRENPDANSIEKTPEEKKEILTGALETWIAGMMEACDGYVKSWDAVNEPMDDGNTYNLKSDPTGKDTNGFYWQDYLGKDFARDVIRLARQYGGDDLILFINDYNLEATYNNNDKCRGLIEMVEYWESDGVTRIDGIGTQMHITYNMNPERQQKQEECVVTMYELLAASGKLVKVTELDMGIVDENGNDILSVNTTFEHQKKMADFYQFIVDKYFEIIPKDQQYGIAHWCPTDSPDISSVWRRGQPVGLWDLTYKRKPAYGGFANGLAGKDLSKE